MLTCQMERLLCRMEWLLCRIREVQSMVVLFCKLYEQLHEFRFASDRCRVDA